MRPRLNPEELLHLRWLLGGGLALLSVCTLFYLEASMWPIAFVGCAAIVGAMGFPTVVAQVPQSAFRFGVPVIALAFGVDLYLNEMIPAFVRLSLLLVVYRAVSFRTGREDMQLALLCLFLIVVTGVLTVSLVFAVQIALFTATSIVFLLTIHVVRDGTPPAPDETAGWALVSRKRMLRRLWGATDLRVVVLGAGMLATVAGLSTAIFVMIPRFEMNNPFTLLNFSKGSNVTGFSEQIALGEVTQIANDNSVAMRIDVAGIKTDGIIPYWRMAALDDYAAGSFSVSRAVEARVGARAVFTAEVVPDWAVLTAPVEGVGAPLGGQFTIYMEAGVSRFVPNPGAYERVLFKELQPVVPNPVLQTVALSRPSASLLSFRIEGGTFDGRMPDPEFAHIHLKAPGAASFEGAGVRASVRHRFLSYPATTLAVPLSAIELEYLQREVDTITRGDVLDAEAFARRACAYLGERHRYSMSVSLPSGKGDEDPVIRWMRAGVAGHCEFFAASFTLLSRTAGFPTRAVTGFKGGAWNTFENYYMVRNSDAHAWCEVYDGRGAWMRVDPTPGASGSGEVSLEAVLGTLAFDGSMSAYIDSLRMLWYRRVVSFDRRAQREVVGSFQALAKDIGVSASTRALRLAHEFVAWIHRPLSTDSRGDIALVMVVLALCGLGLRRMGIRASDWAEYFSRADAPTRRRAGRLLQRVQIRLADPPRRRDWNVSAARGIEHDLIAIRFGRKDNWPDPLSVFRAARRLL